MNKEELKKSITKAIENDPNKEDIKTVSLFGSHIHGTAKADSDVDLLIEFEPGAVVGFFELAQIRRNIMKYIKKNVDLVTPSALSEFFRDEVINQAEFIYEKR